MGRLLNTLAKYVEITGSSKFIFTSPGSESSTPLSKHRQSSNSSSQPHIYSDVDAASSTLTISQPNGKIQNQKNFFFVKLFFFLL